MVTRDAVCYLSKLLIPHGNFVETQSRSRVTSLKVFFKRNCDAKPGDGPRFWWSGRALFCESICATKCHCSELVYLGAESFPSFQDAYQRSLQDMCWTGIY